MQKQSVQDTFFRAYCTYGDPPECRHFCYALTPLLYRIHEDFAMFLWLQMLNFQGTVNLFYLLTFSIKFDIPSLYRNSAERIVAPSNDCCKNNEDYDRYALYDKNSQKNRAARLFPFVLFVRKFNHVLIMLISGYPLGRPYSTLLRIRNSVEYGPVVSKPDGAPMSANRISICFILPR
jgi:hypothetical protein